jgi:hypothetical protein
MSSDNSSAGEKSLRDSTRQFRGSAISYPSPHLFPGFPPRLRWGNSRLDLFRNKSTGFSSCSLCSLCSQEKRKKRLEKLPRLSSHPHSHIRTLLQKPGTRGTPHNQLILLLIYPGTPKSAGNGQVRAVDPALPTRHPAFPPSFRKSGEDGAGGSRPVTVVAPGGFPHFSVDTDRWGPEISLKGLAGGPIIGTRRETIVPGARRPSCPGDFGKKYFRTFPGSVSHKPPHDASAAHAHRGDVP